MALTHIYSYFAVGYNVQGEISQPPIEINGPETYSKEVMNPKVKNISWPPETTFILVFRDKNQSKLVAEFGKRYKRYNQYTWHEV